MKITDNHAVFSEKSNRTSLNNATIAPMYAVYETMYAPTVKLLKSVPIARASHGNSGKKHR
jgi:hypothetical protein